MNGTFPSASAFGREVEHLVAELGSVFERRLAGKSYLDVQDFLVVGRLRDRHPDAGLLAGLEAGDGGLVGELERAGLRLGGGRRATRESESKAVKWRVTVRTWNDSK